MTATWRPRPISVRGRAPWAAVLAVFFIAVPGVVLAGEQAIHVALRVEQYRRGSRAGTLIAGDRLGVVCFETVSPLTVSSTAVPKLLEELRAKMTAGAVPAVTSARTVDLPVAQLREVADVPCEVTLFEDTDDDGRWQPGESYVTAWNGSRDSVRLVHRANGGWRLIRGGAPRPAHLPSDLLVFVDPVVGEPVP